MNKAQRQRFMLGYCEIIFNCHYCNDNMLCNYLKTIFPTAGAGVFKIAITIGVCRWRQKCLHLPV